jgi:cystathionine beta-lyase/cystathionine gamma-synthase
MAQRRVAALSNQLAPPPPGLGTLAVRHYGLHPAALKGLSLPIAPSSTFALDSCASGATLSGSGGSQDVDAVGGFLYSRWAAPTAVAAAQAIAALEGAPTTGGCQLFASGMAAIAACLFTVLSAGDHAVVARSVYGGTYELLARVFARLRVDVTWVDATQAASFGAAMTPRTRLVYTETPANPTLRLTDLAAVGALSRAAPGCTHVCDATFASPACQRTLDVPGVDVVLHSGTKYLGGHSDLLAGAVCSRSAECVR